MAKITDVFLVLIMIQLLYSFTATTISHALNSMSIESNEFIINVTETDAISEDISRTLERQKTIPILDLGAILFFSGNIVLDLVINFFTAIPSMFTFLIDVFGNVFSVEATLLRTFKLMIYSVTTIIYFYYLILFLLSIRSRGGFI